MEPGVDPVSSSPEDDLLCTPWQFLARLYRVRPAGSEPDRLLSGPLPPAGHGPGLIGTVTEH
ncbi:hypothetical protein GL263_00205 [Streptomyces durbertensis]|uniref:Uncharacterized protein n=1 Tax=Streptomyces durbertensis TaxID=2448886 RepID=A0ABR6E9I4_9ACTN|nr:hypothetical protein [Streptomyces durbertensis]MBB1242005.1 hypothetical protein [Streptomyces durbertensis]